MLPSSLVMWEEAPLSITQPPCCRARLFKAVMRAPLFQDGEVVEGAVVWYTGAAVVV